MDLVKVGTEIAIVAIGVTVGVVVGMAVYGFAKASKWVS
jgi:hypothetical protein